MEEKLRKKRIRKIALIVLPVLLAAGIGFSMTVEKADYREALGEEIESAQELLGSAVTGYDKGEYLPEAVTLFQECIEAAKSVFEDEESVYDDQKKAYEKLKADEDAFKKTANEKDLKKKEVKEKEEKIEEELEPEKVEKTVNEESDSSDNDNNEASEKKSEKKSSTEKKTSEKKSNDSDSKEEVKTKDDSITVTIQIRCDNLVGHVEDGSIAAYVPSSGVILGKTEYSCKEDATVYDVLYAVCRNNNIHIESQYTPVYNSQYVEAINHIYEFDGGSESGWMFRVNGGYPDYACSSYALKDGDNIVWAYTCNLGKDIGDSF